MKSILTVFGLTLVVVLGFVYLRDDGSSFTGRSTPPTRATNTGRPEVPRKGKKGAKGPRKDKDDNSRFVEDGFEPFDPSAFAPTYDPKDWARLVDEGDLIRIEDAWSVDLSKVDYSADVLVRANGKDITARDLQRWICLTQGSHLLDALVLETVGRHLAEQRGDPYGLTDEQWDVYMDEVLAQEGMTRAEHDADLVARLNLPLEACLRIHRSLVEAMMAYHPPVTVPEELPEAMRYNLDDEDQAYVTTVLTSLKNPRDDPKGSMAQLVSVTTPLTRTFGRVARNERFRRYWTAFDAELPEDAVGGVFVDSIPRDVISPPWALPGEVRYIKTAEVWKYVRDTMDDVAARDQCLRELIWTVVLRDALAADGFLVTPEDAWNMYAFEYIQRSKSLMILDWLTSGIYGFPSNFHYRNVMNIYNCFLMSQPEGWESDEKLEDFYERNRFFVQGWQPAVEVVLFPPYVFDEGVITISWDAAREQAEDFKQQVEEGANFTKLRREHHLDLTEKFADYIHMGAAADFAIRFQQGALQNSVYAIQQVLKENRYDFLTNCASVVRNAMVRLKPMEISPVWKTPAGYVVMRVRQAAMANLEEEFEDLKFQTRQAYEDNLFRHWVNDTMNKAEIEVL